MYNNIKSFDNVFEENFFRDLNADIMLSGWFKQRSSYVPKDRSDNINYPTFWSQPSTVRENIAINRPIILESAKKIKKIVEDEIDEKLYCWRIGINGQTYGQNGTFHDDYSSPHAYTVVFFAHDIWEPAWGGELIINDTSSKQNTFLYFPCKPNTAVLFPSSFFHVGNGPSRECFELRVSLAYGFCTEKLIDSLNVDCNLNGFTIFPV